jgi:hypothetical protein
VEAYIRKQAGESGINVYQAVETVRCESSFNEHAEGDGGNSYGAWQIHLPSHPQVTKECALDLACATDFALQLFKESPEKWTCYRLLFL